MKGRFSSDDPVRPIKSAGMLVTGNFPPETLAEASAALNQYLSKDRWYDARLPAAARFTARLDRVSPYWSEITYTFQLIPRKGTHGQVSDYRTGKFYHGPKTFIDEIPYAPGLAYRGMSWEEWLNVKKLGYIKSLGEHNFSNQNQASMTSYAPKPDMAESYAGGFAPWMHLPAHGLPGVVVAVPAAGMLTNKDNPIVPQGELASTQAIPISAVKRLWLLVPTKIREGYLEVVVDKLRGGKTREGSRSSPSARYAIVEGKVNTRGRF